MKYVAYGLRPDRRCVCQATSSLKAAVAAAKAAWSARDGYGDRLYGGAEVFAIEDGKSDRLVWFRIAQGFGLSRKDYDALTCRACKFEEDFCQCGARAAVLA